MHGLKQIHAAGHIGSVVQLRIPMRFRHEGLAGEMEHAFDGVRAESLLQVCRVANVASEKRSLPCEFLMAGGKIIEDKGFESALVKGSDGVASNVAGTPCDQDHDAITFLKYSIVFFSPSSVGTSGCHPRMERAR